MVRSRVYLEEVTLKTGLFTLRSCRVLAYLRNRLRVFSLTSLCALLIQQHPYEPKPPIQSLPGDLLSYQ
jgi:hypothetical protein